MLSSLLLITLSAPQPEIARIQQHLLGAEQLLLARDLSTLTAEQRRNRARAIARLHDYRVAGRFPKNLDFPDRRKPYFIDAEGTRCAMAHLIEASGEKAMVAKIAGERNNAYVKELVDEPGLASWLDTNGLTVEEAARIQPTYCHQAAECVCGGNEGVPTGTAEVEWKSMPEGVVAEIGAIHGVVAGYQIGDRIEGASEPTYLGQRHLVLMASDGSAAKAVPLDFLTINAADEVACGQIAVPLSVAAEAAGQSDCVARLSAVKSELGTKTECTGFGTDNDSGGCTATSASGQPWILALVGLVLHVGRSIRKRRRSTPNRSARAFGASSTADRTLA